MSSSSSGNSAGSIDIGRRRGALDVRGRRNRVRRDRGRGRRGSLALGPLAKVAAGHRDRAAFARSIASRSRSRRRRGRGRGRGREPSGFPRGGSDRRRARRDRGPAARAPTARARARDRLADRLAVALANEPDRLAIGGAFFAMRLAVLAVALVFDRQPAATRPARDTPAAGPGRPLVRPAAG